jgi:type II secretory pathway pseudopilin PulG
MTLGPIVLAASVLVIIGILIGSRFTQWKLEMQARRQTAAQLSLSRQLLELRAARQNNYSDLSQLGTRQASSTAEPRKQRRAA